MAVSSLLRHIAALTLGAALVSLPHGAIAASDHGSVVCSIPVGSDGVHYRNVDTPDELAWGPKSFAIDRRGNFYILDTVADRILVYSRDCRRLRSIRLPPELVGAKDLEVADGFWVLDAAALTPTVYRLSLRGAVEGKYPSPIGLSDGLSGISLANDGSVQVEAHFGFLTVPLLTGRASNGLARRLTEGFSRRGVRYRTEISSDSPNEGVIAVGDKQIAIGEATALSTLRIVHVSDDNRIYAAVGANGTDETLRQYRADGTLLRSAVLPKQEFIYVDRNVRVDSRGGAYVVVALPERFEIRRLRFSSRAVGRTTERPKATAPSRAVALSPAAGTPIESAKACLVFRPNQIKTAKQYINSKTLITEESIATFCEARIKPRYLNGEARYSSVPYAWGEWDTVPIFKDHMFNQEQAGDINTSKVPKVPRACGRGVDCSGLVSRAWGVRSTSGERYT
jgi:hypothetical protein